MDAVPTPAGKALRPRRLLHEAYVWAFRWTPGLAEAVRRGAGTFSGYRVLVAERGRDGEWLEPAVDLAALRESGLPVTAVLRWDGTLEPPGAAALGEKLREVLRAWTAAGLAPVGVEIDHDCATARLASYVEALAVLEHALPEGLRLSVTVLPTWMASRAGELDALRALADETVLQVHSVEAPRGPDSPRGGLFDAQRAGRWVAAFSAQGPKPFRVALPGYAMTLGSGHEAPAELGVEPEEVSGFLRELERAPPRGLSGLLWFRLGGADDALAWSLTTFAHVTRGLSRPTLVASLRAGSTPGSFDLRAVNPDDVDLALPRRIVLDRGGCDFAEAVAGYTAVRRAEGWLWVRTNASLVRGRRERVLGWLRCAAPPEVHIDEAG